MNEKMKQRLLVGAAAIAISLTTPLVAQQADKALLEDLKAEITDLDGAISASQANEVKYTGGALALYAALNTQTLSFTKSVLEARVAAEEGGVPVEVVAQATQPDPKKAEEILQEILKQQQVVAAAKAEAANMGGLIAALAETRYQTELVTLAQLRQGWIQAKYGIYFPDVADAGVAPSTASASTPMNVGSNDPSGSTDPAPSWADPAYPDIDYDTSIFREINAQGFEITGWWGLSFSKAALDDSPQVLAVNVSDWGSDYASNNPNLKIACYEHEPRVIFDTDDYLMTEYQAYSTPVTVRIDNQDATNMSWSNLTDNSGVGLFGEDGEDMIRDLKGAEKVFLRLREKGGEQHDLTSDLRGSDRVFAAVAEACSFSLLKLTPADYRGIQAMLNAAGFDTGTPDGVWGKGSQTAMRDYQSQNNLTPTGAPDEATLKAMGMDIN